MFDKNASRQTPSATKEHEASEFGLTLVGTGWSCRLQQSLVIGRDPDCDLRIDDDHIGGRHAEIYSVGTQWWVRDLGSADGTFVKGEIIEAEPLATPSEIRLGVGGPTLHLEGQDDSMEAWVVSGR